MMPIGMAFVLGLCMAFIGFGLGLFFGYDKGRRDEVDHFVEITKKGKGK